MWPQERGRCKMLTIRKIRGRELKRFKKLEGEYHYMGETRSGGDTLRLVAEEDGEWVALMVWGSACYRLKDRDAHVGWTSSLRARTYWPVRLVERPESEPT